MDIRIKVNGQTMDCSGQSKIIVEGSQKFVRFNFQLSEDWDELTVFAQFRQGDKSYNAYLDDYNSVYLPPEIISGTFALSLYGSGGEDIRATTNQLKLEILRSFLKHDGSSTEISNTLYEQLIKELRAGMEENGKFADDIETLKKDASEKADKSELGTYLIRCSSWHLDPTGRECAATTIGLQNALDYAKENGYSRCVLESGTYLLDCAKPLTAKIKGGIAIPSGITLDLSGDVTLKVKPNAVNEAYCLLLFEKCNNSGVVGGTLAGDRDAHDYTASGTHEFGYLIAVRISENIKIENVKCIEATGDCIAVGGGYTYPSPEFVRNNNISVKNCCLDGARRNNISVTDCLNSEITGCIITNAGTVKGTSPMCGIDLEPNLHPTNREFQIVDNIVISNCRFEGNKMGAIDILHPLTKNITVRDCVSDGSVLPNKCKNIKIVNNIFEKGELEQDAILSNPIPVTKEDDSLNLLISGNKCTGMMINLRGKGIVCDNNTVNGSHIYLSDVNDVKITNNTLIHGTVYGELKGFNLGTTDSVGSIGDIEANGIQYKHYCDNILISNNEIRGAAISAYYDYGIQIKNHVSESGADNITVSGNNVFDRNFGIYISEKIVNVAVKNNSISSTKNPTDSEYKAKNHAVYIYGSNSSAIVGNIINGTLKAIHFRAMSGTKALTMSNNSGIAGNQKQSITVIADDENSQKAVFDCSIIGNSFKALEATADYMFVYHLTNAILQSNVINSLSNTNAINTANSTNSTIANNVVNSAISKNATDTEQGTVIIK